MQYNCLLNVLIIIILIHRLLYNLNISVFYRYTLVNVVYTTTPLLWFEIIDIKREMRN